MNLAERVAALRPTAVNRVLQEARQLQAEGPAPVSLMRGQPDTATPLFIVEAAEKALRDGHTGYANNQGEPILRHAVVEKLWRDNDLTYDADREILITDGATAGIFAALAVLIQPGDEVLLPDPIYDAYAGPIAMWGGRAAPVRSAIRGGRFIVERAALDSARMPRSRVLLLNTPWNPTGTVFTRAELGECMDFAIAHDLYVISDEIYENLVYDGSRHVSPAVLSPDARARTVLVNSLSKTYSMTGWRVGYCAAPAEIVRGMVLVWQQFSRGPATFVQHAAAAALTCDQACARKMAAEYQERRDAVVRALNGLGGVVPLVPQGGLFVMVDVRGLGMPSDEVRRFLLREAGVVVIHGSAYGEGGEGTLRVSFAAGGRTLEQGLKRLRDGLKRLSELSRGKGRP
jgi:aspartate/methionine/tyrosine aminotransferase